MFLLPSTHEPHTRIQSEITLYDDEQIVDDFASYSLVSLVFQSTLLATARDRFDGYLLISNPPRYLLGMPNGLSTIARNLLLCPHHG